MAGEISGGALLLLSGLSKIAGLPQMKLGWIVVGGPERARGEALRAAGTDRGHVLIGSQSCAGGGAEAAGGGGAGARADRGAHDRNLALLRAAVAGTALDILDVEGGWYATARVPRTHTEEEWTLALLERRNVLVQPGFFYDFESEAFLVLSLLTAEAVRGRHPAPDRGPSTFRLART